MIELRIFLLIGIMMISRAGLSEVEIDECSANENGILKLFEKINKTECKAKGAWFYKIEQQEPDESIGISATFNLPKFEHDPKRYFTNPAGVLPPHTVGPLDRASVYLGGQIGGTELDAGLTWDRVYDEKGNPILTNDGKEKFAFRPFWRATEKLKSNTAWHNPSLKETAEIKDPTKLNLEEKIQYEKNKIVKSICDQTQEKNNSCSSKNTSFENPGTEMSMKLEIIGKFPDKQKHGNRSIVRMKIFDINNDKHCFVTCFEHLGEPGNNKNSWKRVSSIDQFTLGPCYTAKNGTVTSTKSKDIKFDSKNNYIPFKYKKKINEVLTEVVTGTRDCRPSRESQKENVLGTSAKLEQMNWKRVELLKKDKSPIPLTTQNSKKILGQEFCKDKTNLKEKEHFIDLSGGINQFGGQSLSIIPKKLSK